MTQHLASETSENDLLEKIWLEYRIFVKGKQVDCIDFAVGAMFDVEAAMKHYHTRKIRYELAIFHWVHGKKVYMDSCAWHEGWPWGNQRE